MHMNINTDDTCLFRLTQQINRKKTKRPSIVDPIEHFSRIIYS